MIKKEPNCWCFLICSSLVQCSLKWRKIFAKSWIFAINYLTKQSRKRGPFPFVNLTAPTAKMFKPNFWKPKLGHFQIHISIGYKISLLSHSFWNGNAVIKAWWKNQLKGNVWEIYLQVSFLKRAPRQVSRWVNEAPQPASPSRQRSSLGLPSSASSSAVPSFAQTGSQRLWTGRTRARSSPGAVWACSNSHDLPSLAKG